MKLQKRNIIAIVSVILCTALLVGALAACKKKTDGDKIDKTSEITSPAATDIRVKLFLPDTNQSALWQTLAADYKAATGVDIVVQTANGNPKDELKTAMESAESAPTLFLFANPRDAADRKDDLLNLKDSSAYAALLDKNLAIYSGADKPVALPIGVEPYGIILNNAIIEKYFALTDRATDYTKLSDIDSQAKFDALVKDMAKQKQALAIDGVFAGLPLKAGDANGSTHRLFSLPLSYEMRKNAVDITGDGVKDLKFSYASNLQSFTDLVVANDNIANDAHEERTSEDAAKDFLLGKTAMILGDSGLWGALNTLTSGTVKEEDLLLIPAYMDLAEANGKQGLAFEVTEYAAVNAKAAEDERVAAAQFISWLVSSEKGVSFLSNGLNILAPYTNTELSLPTNPLKQNAYTWLKNGDVSSINSYAALGVHENFRDKVLNTGLAAYAKGTDTWDKFKEKVVEGWHKLFN